MSHKDKGKQPIYAAASPTSFARSILKTGRGETTKASTFIQDPELESFHNLVSDRFTRLYNVNPDYLLSLPWLHDLLNAFGSCQDQFEFILSKSQLHQSPTNKFATDYFEMCIQALDILNATRDGIARIWAWLKHLEIVLTALDPERSVLQYRRAKKALDKLASEMDDYREDTESSSSSMKKLIGDIGDSSIKDDQQHQSESKPKPSGYSLRLPCPWSASKQLQSFANCLHPPRGSEVAATNGLAVLGSAMSFVLLFVLWVLVAAIPCQGRSLEIQFKIPRQFVWSESFGKLHERIMQIGTGERKNSNGILREIHKIEKCTGEMLSVMESAQGPLSVEEESEIDIRVTLLHLVSRSLKDGLESFEHQVKETFRKVAGCRIRGLETMSRNKEQQ